MINQTGRQTIALIITFLMLFSNLGLVFAESNSDITGHWAEGQIRAWLEKGLINGYPDDTFKPNKDISRAEFMSLVNKAFDYNEASEIDYTDVSPDSWYAGVVAVAKKAGYIDGYPDNTIKPNAPITRQEATVIIAKIKNLDENEAGLDSFKDAKNIANWSKGAVGAVVLADIMKGYPDDTFKPGNPIKRGEAVVALDKALNYEAGDVIFDKAGTYGPETGQNTIKGNVVIKAKDIVLQNTIVEGNLLLAKEIEEGDVTLKNLEVKGSTDIEGGGNNSIYINDSRLGNVTINKENGRIRVVVSGETKVGRVNVKSGGKLEEKDLTGEGFREIIINATSESKIILDGSFEAITIDSKDITLELPENTVVEKLIVDKTAKITGKGTIKNSEINANGVTFEKLPEEMEVQEGIRTPIVNRNESSGRSSGSTGNNNNPTSYQVSFTVISAGGGIVDGAEIVFEGSSKLTDENGKAVFTNIQSGSQKTYTISAAGYNTQSGSVDIDNKNVEISIELDNSPLVVNNLFIEKDIVFTNESTNNRITIEASHSSNTLALANDEQLSPIELFAKVNGAWESKGFFYDDGELSQHGDEIKGDRVHSNIFTFNEAQEGKLNLRIVATKADGERVTKDFSIDVLENTHGEDAEKAVESLNTIENTIMSELQSQATVQSVVYKVQELAEQEEGATVEALPNSNVIEIQYATGIRSIISVEEENETTRSFGMLSTDLLSKDTVQNAVYDSVYESVYSGESIGSSSVLIWAPFATAFGEHDESEELRQLLESSNLAFDVQVLQDSDANIEALKTMTNNGLIVLSTHGSGGKWIGTGEVFGNENKEKYEPQQKLGKMAMWKKLKVKDGDIIPSQTVYAVNDKWFESNLKGEFPNSIIINNSCESTKTDRLWKVFEAKGAGAYLGYNGVVSSEFAAQQAKEFVQGIALGKPSGLAYIQKSDPAYSNSYWEILGRDDLIFSNQGLINGSFEQGLVAWKTEGDGRAISGLSYLKPTKGNRMGIISTGLGYTEKQGAVSQTLIVPEDSTTISFDWNYISEEFIEYIGTQFDDPYQITIATENDEEVILDLSVNKIAEQFGASNPNDHYDYNEDSENSEEAYDHSQYGGELIYVSPDIVFDVGDVWMTGWQHFEYNISSFRGKYVTIKFNAVDGGDSIFDTAVLLDNIVIE